MRVVVVAVRVGFFRIFFKNNFFFLIAIKNYANDDGNRYVIPYLVFRGGRIITLQLEIIQLIDCSFSLSRLLSVN